MSTFQALFVFFIICVFSVTSLRIEKLFLPNYLKFSEIRNSKNISKECLKSILFAYDSLVQHQEPWASAMFNSWTQSLPNGFLLGTVTDYGDFDQCLSVQVPTHTNQTSFKTKYCFKIKEVLFHSETIEIKYLGSQYFFSAETTG